MKATITLENGKQAIIELSTEQQGQIANLYKRDFNIKYRPNEYFVIGTESVYTNQFIDSAMAAHGRCRKTRELAERALLLNQQANMLGELAAWLEPDWSPKENEDHYYVYFDSVDDEFVPDYSPLKYRAVGAPLMSKVTVDTICDALNNGDLPELAQILKA